MLGLDTSGFQQNGRSVVVFLWHGTVKSWRKGGTFVTLRYTLDCTF